MPKRLVKAEETLTNWLREWESWPNRLVNSGRVIQLLTVTVTQLAESMTVLRQTQQITVDRFVETFVRFSEQAEADRQSFQAETRRIWEYLLSQNPNGRGEQRGEG